MHRASYIVQSVYGMHLLAADGTSCGAWPQHSEFNQEEIGRQADTQKQRQRRRDKQTERQSEIAEAERSKEGRHDDLLYHVILLLAPTTPSFKIRKQELREYVPLAYTQLSPGFVHCCGWVAGLQNSARGRRAPLFMIMIISLGTDVVPPAERCRTRRNRRPKDVCNR